MNKSEKKLIKNYNALGSAEREMLLGFSEFLAGRSSKFYTIEKPAQIQRPPDETIVAAVKRLSATYSMLDKTRLLSDVSDKVTEHVVYGKAVEGVIDELEDYFRLQYDEYVKEKEQAIESSMESPASQDDADS